MEGPEGIKKTGKTAREATSTTARTGRPNAVASHCIIGRRTCTIMSQRLEARRFPQIQCSNTLCSPPPSKKGQKGKNEGKKMFPSSLSNIFYNPHCL